MSEYRLTEHEMRLLALGNSFIAIDENMVNLDDLISITPGRIVRCNGNPSEAIKWVQCDDGQVGVVAGWISEDEPVQAAKTLPLVSGAEKHGS